ncbi:hypothetical protein CMUS01_15078 [Colletotrichum musicola]|uniref:Uncharacterized protein n=1 Tax=Colletotrichum musicola TaxID=2175873 RepID=A0A8H6IZ15_9PEZI|nr:hypothetical protein CMUS01_15078 [Colletotrichum musicola]
MVSPKSLLVLLSAALYTGASCTPDHGSWYIEIRLGGGAQGHRQGWFWATHSSNPGVRAESVWLYDPEVDDTRYTTTDPTLNHTRIQFLGLQDVNIQQTVLGVPLKGSGQIDVYFDVNSNGRGGLGNTTIVSELDD